MKRTRKKKHHQQTYWDSSLSTATSDSSERQGSLFKWMEESVTESRSFLAWLPGSEQLAGKRITGSSSAHSSTRPDTNGDQATEPFPDIVERTIPSNGMTINYTKAGTTNTSTPLSTSISSNPPHDRSRPVSGIVPPWWRHSRKYSRASNSSVDTFSRKPTISLEDHTQDPDSPTSRGLWAKSVAIDDHVVVQGKTGVGAYTVWVCKIQTLDVRDFLCVQHSSQEAHRTAGWPDGYSYEVYSFLTPCFI